MAARRPAALASVLLALAVTASACASDPPPAAAPPETMPSSTSSAPATTTSAPPTTTTQAPVDPVVAKIPKAARANTQEGAAAFAKFFYEKTAEAWTRPDAKVLPGLFDSSCKTCVALQETAEYLEKHDQRFIGDPRPLVVRSASAMSFLSGNIVIAVHVEENAGKIVGKKGETIQNVEATGRQTFIVTLERTNDRWIVVKSQVEELG